jgi:hypothetical protein
MAPPDGRRMSTAGTGASANAVAAYEAVHMRLCIHRSNLLPTFLTKARLVSRLCIH